MSYTELSSKDVVGRKNYRCIWCGEVIEIGMKHNTRSYVFEGDFRSERMHLECKKMMSKMPHDEICDGFLPYSFERPGSP